MFDFHVLIHHQLSRMEQTMRNATRERARRLDTKVKGYSQDLSRLERDLQHQSLVGGGKPGKKYDSSSGYDEVNISK